jgi:hypothetical protein
MNTTVKYIVIVNLALLVISTSQASIISANKPMSQKQLSVIKNNFSTSNYYESELREKQSAL